MTKTYLGQLQIEANVPNKSEIQEFINVTVDFQILCPKCGPKGKNIKKNGFDKKVKGNPQLFYCHSCPSSFYPHTSWLFSQFTDLIIEEILDMLFIENLRPKAIAKMFSVSQSLISKIRYQCFDILKRKVDIIRSEAEKLKKLENLPLVFQSAIWWDETYFRISKSNYCLILVINAKGQVLGYKFSKTRKKEDYLSLLRPIIESLPEIPIFIGDGCPTYISVCEQLKKECFLIQHIHSHPWKDAKLHHFKFLDKPDVMEQITIQLPYDSFMEEERVTAYSAKRIVTISSLDKVNKKRGRPKGSKDTKKRAKWGSQKNKKRGKKLKKRGPKNIKKDGSKFTFEPFPYPDGWKITEIKQATKSTNLLTPTISELSIILNVTYEVMSGGYIHSNFIESKNNLVKQIIEKKGLKNVYQHDYLLGSCLLARGDINQCYWDNFNIDVQFRSKLGFNQMLNFFQPDCKKIKIF